MLNITIEEMTMLEIASGYGAEEIKKQIASALNDGIGDVKHYEQLLEVYRLGREHENLRLCDKVHRYLASPQQNWERIKEFLK